MPLDGELGLGPDSTVISRIRRQFTDGEETLTLNDNDNPAAFNMGPYFDAGGDGSDLTMTIQTLAGSVDIPVSTAYRRGGANFAHFTLTAAAQALIDAIVTDDRFIIAFARPAEPTNRDAAVTAAGGTPTASIAAEAQDLNRDAAVSASASAPTASPSQRKRRASTSDAEVSASFRRHPRQASSSRPWTLTATRRCPQRAGSANGHHRCGGSRRS